LPDNWTALRARFPWLQIEAVLADADAGYQCCLDPVWEAGALRRVGIRADKGDEHAVDWLTAAIEMAAQTGDTDLVLHRFLRLEPQPA
jgi:hypothetical protein